MVRERVTAAREQQVKRQYKCNAMLSVPEIERYAEMSVKAKQVLNQVMTRFQFSARVYHRIIKVARTIADLRGASMIDEAHLAEALNYRCLDRIKTIV